MGKRNGDKVFLPEKHTVVIAQLGFEPRSLALKPLVLPLHQLLPYTLTRGHTRKGSVLIAAYIEN